MLPFRNMSADPEQEYFCEGMAEEIIDALAKLDGLRVVSRSSAFGFKGQSPDLREVGRKLNVRSVLEGSVRKSGDRLRINAQLINAEDGYHLWSERYDRDMGDVFAVQDEIARAVVNELQLKLLGGDQTPLVRPATNNLEAYNLCLKGRYYYAKLTPDDLDKSLDCFNQARRLEPTYAQAHAGIAQVYVISGGIHFVDPRTVMPIAKEAAVAALRSGETVAEAHFAMASVLHHFDRKWREAEAEYRRALELNPSDAWTRGNYAFLLATLGRTDAAITEARAAIERDPISSTGRWVLPQVFLMARQFDEAIAEARAGIELDPDYAMFYWGLAAGLALLGKNDEAIEAMRQPPVVKTGGPFLQGQLGWLLGRAGLKEEALAVLDDLKKRRAEIYVGEVSLAYVCVGLGDYEQAISWLETAFDEHDVQLEYICEGWPIFDPLRSDPRFQALLKRMNFPSAPRTG